MLHTCRLLACHIAFVCLVTLAAPAAFAQPADEEAVRARVLAYAKATEAGDVAERVKFYADDVDLWLSTSNKLIVGKTAIGKELAAIQLPADMKFALDVARIAFVAPDVALVDAGYRVTVADQKIAGHVFYVVVKRQGQWLIRSVPATQTSPVP